MAVLERRRRNRGGTRAGKAAALALVAVYAVLALGSGLDRIAVTDGAFPNIAIWPVGAGRARAAATAALERRAPAAALALAREAVRRDPLDATGVGLLGQAALATGDRAYAARAFAVAARMGWREPLAQSYLLSAALARGDYRTAGDHLDAILRQSPDIAGRNLLLAPFDASAAGRAELATRLAARPAWAAGYFGDTAAAESGDPLARGDVAALLVRRGVRDCALIAPLIAGLTRHDHQNRALALYRASCARPGEGVVPVDGRFERANAVQPATLLDWRVTDEATIAVGFERRAGFPGRAAIVTSTAPFTRPFAAQPLALAAGRYRLTWRARDAEGGAATAVEAALTCDAAGEPWLAKRPLDAATGRFAAEVTIPPGCPQQRLVLGIGSQAAEVAVGDVAIMALGAGTTP